MRDVPPDEMKHLVKDLKGGVQIEKILDGSPNKEIQAEDIIIKAEGKRIMKGHQLLALFKEKPQPVKVEVLREGKRKIVSVRAEDVTSRVEKNLTELQKSACKFEDVKGKSSLCKEKI
jgi:S1-C subfamily serine protease